MLFLACLVLAGCRGWLDTWPSMRQGRKLEWAATRFQRAWRFRRSSYRCRRGGRRFTTNLSGVFPSPFPCRVARRRRSVLRHIVDPASNCYCRITLLAGTQASQGLGLAGIHASGAVRLLLGLYTWRVYSTGSRAWGSRPQVCTTIRQTQT